MEDITVSNDVDVEVLCISCGKSFASIIALQNHSRLEHELELSSTNILETTPIMEQGIVRSNNPHIVTPNRIISKVANQIMSQIPTESLLSLANKNNKYVLIKSDEINKDEIKSVIENNRKEKKKKYYKPKRIRGAPVEIRGPFECLAAVGSDGELCRQKFENCCEYTIHYCDNHQLRRRRTISCQICEKILSYPIVRKQQKIFKCKICLQHFLSSQALTDHINQSHEKPKTFDCDLCNKSFTHSSKLDRHMAEHSAVRVYNCHLCDKGFERKFALVAHMRSHSDEKPFTCIICYKGFKFNGQLKTHMRSHTNIAPYSCPNCDKRYKQAHPAKVHIAKCLATLPSGEPDQFDNATVETIEDIDDGNVKMEVLEMEECIQIENEVEVATCD